MRYRLFALLIVSGCIFSFMTGCSLLPQNEAACPKASRPITTITNIKPVLPSVNPPKDKLPIPDHPTICAAVAKFQRGHRSFQIELDRACNYVVPAKQVFRKRGLPPDLVYVALVESGFTPKARSRANAVGMWQIISRTGARLGLTQNRWVDERCDPIKAAKAAADYLSTLYDAFGNWPLALAGYNAGEKTVRDALDKSGLKTFWELSDAGWLPAETRAYVPAVYAAVAIARNPVRYGFWYTPDHYIARYEKVAVPGGVKLAWVGKQIGVSRNELLNCNPELCKPVTPPCCSEYELCVPRGCRDDLLSAIANRLSCEREQRLQEEIERKSVVIRTPVAPHRVSHGDTWASLARRCKCSAKELAALNHTRTSKLLKRGQLLRVPASSGRVRISMTRPSKHSVATVVPAKNMRTALSGHVRIAMTSPSRYSAATFESAKHTRTASLRLINERPKKAGAPVTLRYKVSKGDTLWTIAERFHVPVKKLCSQNAMKPNQKIKPGAQLAISSRRPGASRIARRR